MQGHENDTIGLGDRFCVGEAACVRSMTEYYLLEGAEAAAKSAEELRAVGDWRRELIAAASAVILAQVAVEGYFHSFLESRLDALGMRHQFNRIRSIPRLENRMEIGLRIATGKAVEKGAQPWQDFHLLRRIRNSLAHYSPEWESSRSEPIRVLESVRITRRFPLKEECSRWDEKFLTADCAAWAVQTAVSMIRFFYDLAGLPRYPAGVCNAISTDNSRTTGYGGAQQRQH